MARVQLPPVQDRHGHYRSDITVTGVTLADTDEPVVVYTAREGGSVITFPSPGVTSGDEGELEAWTAPNTVSIEIDSDDDSYDNPKIAELISWEAITDYIDLQPFTASTGVPGANVMDYGATGDGSTDDHAAIQAAIEDAPDLPIDSQNFEGWRVTMPPGEYYVSEAIVINRAGTHLMGSGRSRNISGSTLIRVANGHKGIIVKYPTGIGGSLGEFTNDPSDTYRGDHCILEGFALAPTGNSLGPALEVHGIDLKAPGCTIRNVSIGNGSLSGFNGDGISINASVPTGNASQSTIMDVRIEGCKRYGVSTFGNDSSACNFINVSCDLNGFWGFYESSFLGNTYIGCHTRDNGRTGGAGGGYKSESSSVFVGCYTEGGQPMSNEIDTPSIQLRATGISNNAGSAPNIVASGGDFANNGGGFRCLTATAAGGDVIEIGNGQEQEKFYIGNGLNGTASAMVLFYDATDGEYQWRYGTAGPTATDGVMAWTDENSVRGEAGHLRVHEGLLLGAPTTANIIKYAGAAPASGTWKRGDILLNQSPSAGGSMGWICTFAGTPGTWKTWGTISA